MPALVFAATAITGLLGSSLPAADAAPAPKTEAAKEKLAATIGNKKITQEAIFAEMIQGRMGNPMELRSTNPKQFELFYRYFLTQHVSKLVLMNEAKAAEKSLMGDPKVAEKVQETKNNTLLGALLSKHIETTVNDAAVKAAYNKKAYPSVVLATILVNDEATAKGIVKSLRSGKRSFDDLAKEYSVDKKTAESGGVMPPLLVDTLPKVLSEHVAKMNPGDFSTNPIEVQKGKNWLVVRVVSRQKKAEFQVAQAYIKDQLSKEALLSLVSAAQQRQKVKLYDLDGKEMPNQLTAAAAAAKAG